MRRGYVALVAALILGGCATAPSQDLVVLLPDKDGKVGTLVVQNQKGSAVLNTAYATARTAPDGSVARGTASQSEIKDVFGSALAAQPPRPISFTLYFESGSDEITAQSKQEVKRILAEMARREAPDITVIGHTDRVGSDPSNDALLQRAGRVKSCWLGWGARRTHPHRRPRQARALDPYSGRGYRAAQSARRDQRSLDSGSVPAHRQ
jgi:outer membrane protein OmpA-like peptidoglycan-associated protein